METILSALLIADSIIVTIVILLQRPNEGGLTASLGGSSFKTTRRGSEKTFHELTIFMSIVFGALALALLLIR